MPINPTKIIQFSLRVMVCCVLLYSLPFICIFTLPKEKRNAIHEQFVYYVATANCRKKANNVAEEVKFLLDKTKKTVRNPTKSEDLKDVSRYRLIEVGYGYCDQQANLFLAICKANGIVGRRIYLYREGKKSHHVVSELFYDGNFHMIDTYNSFWFINKKGQVASMREINAGEIDTAATGKLPEHVTKTFGSGILWRIGNPVGDSFQNLWQAKLMLFNYSVFGASFYRGWFYLFDRRGGEILEWKLKVES